MTAARELTEALGGRWCGSYGVALCPAHADRRPSLSLRDGDDRILLACHAGCDRRDIIAALRERGLWEPSPSAPQPRRRAPAERAPIKPDPDALAIWRAAQPAGGTRVETYLRSRGITTLDPPPSLRFAPALTYPGSGISLPAMVAAVQAPDRRITAVHRTFLAL